MKHENSRCIRGHLGKKIPKSILIFPDNCVIQYENSYSIVPVLITMCNVTVSFFLCISQLAKCEILDDLFM